MRGIEERGKAPISAFNPTSVISGTILSSDRRLALKDPVNHPVL